MPTPAGQDTNKYRCESCGRFFNEEDEFARHRKECETREQRHHEAGRDYAEDRDWISTP